MVEVAIYCGHSIEYNALKREFQVWKGSKKILVANTQDEIEAKIYEMDYGKKKGKEKPE